MLMEILPSEYPNQLILFCDVIVEIAGGSVMVIYSVSVQPLGTVTKTLYHPGASPLILSVVCPFDHR